MSEENKIQTLQLLSWVPHKKTDIVPLIKETYQLIQQSKLANNENKTVFLNWWLLIFDLSESVVRERIFEALQSLNITNDSLIKLYVSIFNANKQFMSDLIRENELNLLQFSLVYANSPDLIVQAIEELVNFLNLNEKQYTLLTWGQNWSKNWNSLITKLSIEQLKSIIIKLTEIHKKINQKKQAMTKKNSNIDNLLFNVKQLLDFAQSELREKEDAKEKEVIGGLFD